MIEEHQPDCKHEGPRHALREPAGARRLAVECDGDQYHTPEVWMEDLHRQRALERAGWTFWRCWGSSFLRDPEACMADLSRKLNEMGIEQSVQWKSI
jgi:very-short-patch-repair endonuclease